MQRLILVRHGIAVPHGTPDLPDDERPLTPKGERRARQVARGLKVLGVKPDRVVTSPLPRARKTAEIVAEVLHATERLETADALRAGASAASIREALAARPEDEILAVGHNPAFTDLVALLLGVPETGAPAFEMKKAGAASFVVREGKYTLEWFAPPAVLRRLP